MCSRYTKACWADFPETASLRVKVEYKIPDGTLENVNPSIIFAIWQVSDIGLRSFAIDCGGYCLGKGRTIALFRRPGMNLSLSDVLYKATLESKGLQYAV